jgi:3,4-dihydroxyphenylacetate 2,3-dioxygenase
MGRLALAAKITHVPSMYLSELDGPGKGRRQAAIDGHIEIGRRCRELGVDTIVVFDTHWLVNAGYHINCAPHFKGVYTSNELPHFISNMAYELDGNPRLGELLAEGGQCPRRGHAGPSGDDAGARVRHAGADALHERRPALQGGVGVGAVHGALPGRQRAPGLGLPARRGRHYDGTVAFFASGSLSHRFAQNGLADEFAFRIWSPFLEAPRPRGGRACGSAANGSTSATCCRSTPAKGHGEGFMHDTAMLLGALGWNHYDARRRGHHAVLRRLRHRPDQRVFPVTPHAGDAIPRRRPAAPPATPGRHAPLDRRAHHASPRDPLHRQPRRRDRHGRLLPHAAADAMLTVRDEAGKPVFPTGGVRVLAYPAPHFAVADGSDRSAASLRAAAHGPRPQRGGAAGLRRGLGRRRPRALRDRSGAPPVGLTVQVDEGPEVFDAKLGNLHPLFNKP